MEVGAYEAKTHLPKLLERVRRGERITITRRGKPVAELRPIAPGTAPHCERRWPGWMKVARACATVASGVAASESDLDASQLQFALLQRVVHG